MEPSSPPSSPPSHPIWTFLPGLHGTSELFEPIKKFIPDNVDAEFIELPTSGKQNYRTLAKTIDRSLTHGRPRLFIAESFSGPLAIRLAARQPDECAGIVLAASFCNAPLNPGFALLPLRPLFMVKPSRHTLKHFLIGDDASDVQISELRSAIKRIPSGTLAKRVRTILNLDEDDHPRIPKIPMLLLQAQSDNLVPWEAQSRLTATYPKAEVHWIESPHLLLQREPEQCMQHIKHFVDLRIAQDSPAQTEAQHSQSSPPSPV